MNYSEIPSIIVKGDGFHTGCTYSFFTATQDDTGYYKIVIEGRDYKTTVQFRHVTNNKFGAIQFSISHDYRAKTRMQTKHVSFGLPEQMAGAFIESLGVKWEKEINDKLPTMDQLIGIDKFNLTSSQRHDCRSLANHSGIEAAVKQAKKFHEKNSKPNE